MALNTGEEILRKQKEMRESGKRVVVSQAGPAVCAGHQTLM